MASERRRVSKTTLNTNLFASALCRHNHARVSGETILLNLFHEQLKTQKLEVAFLNLKPNKLPGDLA